MKLPTEPDQTPTLLFNPSKADFVCQYNGKDVILPSRVITEYPKWLADHIAKHLAQKLALEEKSGLHFADRVNTWKERIYVKL